MNTHVLVYNTKLVKGRSMHNTFDEVTQSKWKGKITMPEDFDIFGMMLKVMGRAKAWSLWRRLAAQEVSLKNSYLARYPSGCVGRSGAGSQSLRHPNRGSSRKISAGRNGFRSNSRSLHWSLWRWARRLLIRIRPGFLLIFFYQKKRQGSDARATFRIPSRPDVLRIRRS